MSIDEKNNVEANQLNVGGLVIYQQVLATGLTLPLEMLLAGEAFGRRYNKSSPKLTTHLISQENKAVTSRAGIQILPDITLENITFNHDSKIESSTTNEVYRPDIILIPSLWRNPRPILKQHQKLISWLNYCWQRGSTLLAVGGDGGGLFSGRIWFTRLSQRNHTLALC